MDTKEEGNLMWTELQAFVQEVEKEQKQPESAGPYIEKIRKILTKYMSADEAKLYTD
ncbi:hypothetical protein [Alkalihalobacillus sp. CinArs1]|uniref:hypothetical protein n=1 Tax=Alkalihalobacillus sp. CinArs1 TaxID=2995314 RepID=UPI0022DE7EEC|nr:hypothetical protein [Alkalihalobacillus sp. CinArs1]